jgi:hypothetical protein
MRLPFGSRTTFQALLNKPRTQCDPGKYTTIFDLCILCEPLVGAVTVETDPPFLKTASTDYTSPVLPKYH